jgi:catechol 2,3-dioxygenase-like lactoylglutathione lyase family enzyme
MLKSDIGHILFNVNLQNLAFYKDLFLFLGWSILYDDPNLIGMDNKRGASLWFSSEVKAVTNDYDGPGMNHLGISVTNQSDVDEVVAYLKKHDVPALFETPRHRPEFSSPGQTYYQVMFESPDRILFEVVYTGPLQES